MNHSEGVRKGSWTVDEDHLLRKCIEIYGEGNWNKVPERAGLNRDRKSCRLRWLNYLSPNIKRGSFSVDEVDLILRMHNLLGNKWSSISDRLPGRTANDVKNYWNTHLKSKKDDSPKNKEEEVVEKVEAIKNKEEEVVEKVKAIRPKPRYLSKDFVWSNDIPSNSKSNAKGKAIMEQGLVTSPDRNIAWWKTLLSENEIGETPIMDQGGPSSANDVGWWENSFLELQIGQTQAAGGTETGPEESNNYDLSFDDNLWNFVDSTITMPKEASK